MGSNKLGSANQEHTPQHGQEHGRVHQVQNQEQHDRDHLGLETHKAGQVKLSETPHESHAKRKNTGVTIYVNRQPYHTASNTFSGAYIRSLTQPPIGPEENIFRVVSGKGDDIKIKDTDMILVEMRDAHMGRHFFSDTVIPAKDAVARRAYFIYLEEGSRNGHDVENWAKAEAQLDKHTVD